MEPSLGRIVVERKDQIVSPVPGERCIEPTFRPAHFLTPTVPSGEFPIPDCPSKTDIKFSEKGSKNTPNLKVCFTGWKNPPNDWKYWTDRMHLLHHSAWKKAGICEAILSSCCKVHRCDDLIYGFVEKWCPKTNTFVFPWGEATMTLEDMMMIGGYSVVGAPVFSSVECSEMKEVEQKLLTARSEISRSKARKASQGQWQRKFMATGGEIEQEAFLAMWLSRFVFPAKTRDPIINKNVLPLAVLLARGTKIALAPAVLAGIYSSLSDLKNAFVDDGVSEVSVSSPFQLLQIWIWERFPSLRPNPVVHSHDQDADQTRSSRWDDLRFEVVVDVRLAIDESADSFRWRPYVIGCETSFLYRDEARLVLIGSGMDEKVEMLVKCLRFSELVGIDPGCIEQYLPHRVSMQFGYDQDVPGPVARANSDQIVAWECYTRNVDEQRLYIAPRLFVSDVTTRYAQWWKKNMAVLSNNPKKRPILEVKYNHSKKMRLLGSPPQPDVLGEGSSSKKAARKGKRDKKRLGSTGSLHEKPNAERLDSEREPSEKNSKDDVAVPQTSHHVSSENNADRVPETVDISSSESNLGLETILEVESGAVDAENGGSAKSKVLSANEFLCQNSVGQTVASNSSSRWIYSIEEVKAMVDDLEKTWAEAKVHFASAARTCGRL